MCGFLRFKSGGSVWLIIGFLWFFLRHRKLYKYRNSEGKNTKTRRQQNTSDCKRTKLHYTWQNNADKLVLILSSPESGLKMPLLMTQWRGIKNKYTIFWHLMYKTQIYRRQRRKWYQSGRSWVLLSSSRMCLCRQTRRRTMCCCWCCWVYLPGGRWSCSPCCSSFVIGAVSGDDATQGLCPLWHLPNSVSLQAHGKGCQIQRLGVMIAVSNSPISLQSQRWPREDQHHLRWGFSAHSRLDRLFSFFFSESLHEKVRRSMVISPDVYLFC